MRTDLNVLIACEFSGIEREAFRKLGYNAYSVDLLPTEIPSSYHVQEDVIQHIKNHSGFYDLMIAHPPCTHLAVSGARWFKDKKEEQEKAMDFFLKFTKTGIPHYAIENPVCIMATEYRKPDQYIQPWEYGHGETKKTSLWLYNLPKLNSTDIVVGREDRIHKLPPGVNRWRDRSRGYSGVANAMAEQWGEYVSALKQKEGKA